MSYVYGLVVQLNGAVSGGACSASVTATDGDYTEKLECGPSNGDCLCQGAGEREGTYELSVESEGEVVATKTVTVQGDDGPGADGCHPRTEHVEFDL